MIIRSDLQVFDPRELFVYDLLSALRPSLTLDVGAHKGYYTKVIKQRCPTAHVIAVEAFPGNHEGFAAYTAGLGGVELVKAGAGRDPGELSFYNNATLTDGSSTIGYLMRDGMTRDPERTIKVPVVTVDSLAAGRHVDFMKIDVQGGEPDVLRGALATMQGPGIDFIYAEFGGEDDTLTILHENGYVIFDTEYTTWKDADWIKTNMPNARWFNRTTGAPAARGAVTAPIPRDLPSYAKWFRDAKDIQTDLLAVHQSAMDRFMAALSSQAEVSA